jgi:hypothetical protein
VTEVDQPRSQDSRGFRDGEPAPRGIERSIRPGTVVPPTVLVSAMGDGALYLHGWRAGPSAYLVAQDATNLRQEPARAFGEAARHS